jgi:hypothetical protein
MPRAFRNARFRGRGQIGEDVNPSAYIVNLADCMLVLACGVIVALVSYWSIDLSAVTELKKTEMTEVDPTSLPENLVDGGAYYIEAGTVYMDPGTGALYMVENSDGSGGGQATGSSAGTSPSGAVGTGTAGASDDSIANARALGAD